MRTFVIKPSADCTPLVKHYLFLNFDKKNQILVDKFIPDGNTAIVFNFEKSVTLIWKDQKILLPAFFVTLPLLHQLKIEVSAPTDTMVIVFNASVFSRIFNLSFANLPKKPFHTCNVFDNFSMFEVLKSLKNPNDKVSFFEKYLIEKYKPAAYIFDSIDIAYQLVISSGGKVRVNQILNDININPRSFRRQFRKRLGINIKALLRIARVNYVWDNIKSGEKIDFQSLIFDCCYFDQSHFINDFRNLVGESPKTFFNRNLREVEAISGKLKIESHKV